MTTPCPLLPRLYLCRYSGSCNVRAFATAKGISIYVRDDDPPLLDSDTWLHLTGEDARQTFDTLRRAGFLFPDSVYTHL